jgi:tetratricopeptide (TPR) repeat protein
VLQATAISRPATSPREVKDLAHALVLKGKLDTAARLLDEHLQRDPADPTLWMQHAELCRKLGRFVLAVASYRQSARLLRKAGHFTRARAALTCAQRLAPRDPSVLADLEVVTAEQRPPPPVLVPVAAAPAYPIDEDVRATRLERRRPALAVVDDLDVVTEPYCPLVDWLLDEA